MSNLALAKRYAKALLALAAAQDAVDAVLAELEGLWQALSYDQDAVAMLADPCIPLAPKLKALRELAEQSGMSDLTHRFLRRLIEARRIEAIGEIGSAFRAMAHERAGALEVQITSAMPLAEAKRAALQQAIETRTGKRVLMAVDVDPALLAGARLRIGNMVLDGSAHARLRVLGDRLTQGSIHED